MKRKSEHGQSYFQQKDSRARIEDHISVPVTKRANNLLDKMANSKAEQSQLPTQGQADTLSQYIDHSSSMIDTLGEITLSIHQQMTRLDQQFLNLRHHTQRIEEQQSTLMNILKSLPDPVPSNQTTSF